jgi:hydroxymethylglutaryl-CoA reductase
VNDSQISGLYRLDIGRRIDRLAERGLLSPADAAALREGRHVLLPPQADKVIENVIGVFGLPFARSRPTSSSTASIAWRPWLSRSRRLSRA